MDRQVVVAVDPERRDAEAVAARREGAGAAARDALEGRDGPLVVDQVQHYRRLVGRGEHQGGVEVGLGGRAVADPRSEEHTSELQSLMRISYAVFCLKKKK